MNSVLQIALVILLTIAGSLLLTEARYHGEESTATKHRHRHHRQEFPHPRPTMQKHLTTPEPEDNDDAFQTYEDAEKKRQHPTKRLPEEDDDDDDEDDDEYDYESLDSAEKTPPIHHRRYQTDEFTTDRRNHRLVAPRGHRTRPDTRLYHTSDYPSRTRDHVSPAVPNDTKDDYEDYEYVKPLSRGHYRHHTHHPHHHQRHYPRNNEVYIPRWRNSWIDDGKVDLDNAKQWSRRKYRHRERDDDMLGDDADDRTKKSSIFGRDERKSRSNDLRRESSGKQEENEDIWKELGDYDDVDVEDEEFDGINDDYFEDISEEREKPPYRTYDEIIKRLTAGEDNDDSEIGVKRDYRNTGKGIEKFLMKDAFGNLKFNGTKISKNLRAVKRNHGGVRSLDSDYLDDYGNNEKGERRNEGEADAAGKEAGRHVYPSNLTEPEDETSAPPSATTPKPPVKITSRPIITITTQKTYDRRNNTAISQQHATNGLQSMQSDQKFQTKKSTVPTRQYKQKAGVGEVMQHIQKVRQEGNCQQPRARVIPVRDVYPYTTTRYIPHCAILHRCSDDTGCCESEALTCVPKQTQLVELYFYATSVGAQTVVKKLSFYNHTKCECREKTEYTGGTEGRFRHEYQLTSPPQNIRIPPQKKSCRCPSEFTPRITADGECQCKCFERDENCIHARRGKAYFSATDRLCIWQQQCAMPTCEFGEYIVHQGKCPKKKDKIESIANYPSNNYHNRQRS
ncbi:sarcoplasmic reticulum histidine-rich calcium-binding protein [Diachasma alloeum]|uniref:sarcoplasmic reticulum histidine-rich calcium-binding protein n=1 Tax=Diachasma alloeum TaxID=454923 RepID=UPI0007381E0F|nr:sarcoplasmic reticulum histidine-rich calcium-binding protein [Diachasma alloeum]